MKKVDEETRLTFRLPTDHTIEFNTGSAPQTNIYPHDTRGRIISINHLSKQNFASGVLKSTLQIELENDQIKDGDDVYLPFAPTLLPHLVATLDQVEKMQFDTKTSMTPKLTGVLNEIVSQIFYNAEIIAPAKLLPY